MADELKATLYCASGEAHTFNLLAGNGSATQGTQANLKDASDSTGSKVQVVGDDIDPGQASYREEWTLDNCAYSGTISYIKVKARHKYVGEEYGAPTLATYRPSINGSDRGSTVNSALAAAESVQQFNTDPADSNAWTQAKINAQKFGWILFATNTTAGSDDVLDVWVTEYAVEVWGPEDQSASPGAVAATATAVAAALMIGVAAVELVASASGNTNSSVSAVAVSASVPTPGGGLVEDSFDPVQTTPVPVNSAGAVVMALRPTVPSSLGDQQSGSGEDSGHIIGPGSGDIFLLGTTIQDPSASGSISHLVAYALVGVRDDVPAPNAYIAATTPQFVVKISGGSRATWGLASGAVPDPGELSSWVSQPITTTHLGAPWTWQNLIDLVELGITAHYTLGTNEYTALRLDEVWLEVHGVLGSPVPPLRLRIKAGNLRLRLPVSGNLEA